jgi:hypothetical protein
MEELFRMMFIRSPEEIPEMEKITLIHPQGNDANKPWYEVVNDLPEHMLILSVEETHPADLLKKISETSDQAEIEPLIRHFLGNDLHEVVTSEEWQDQKLKLNNGILFVKARNRDDIRLDKLVDAYRAIETVERAANGQAYDLKLLSLAPLELPVAGLPPLKPSPQPWTGDVVIGIVGIPALLRPIRPAGVANLLIVRQKLLGYKLSDIAHIENVLASESRTRTHRRKVTTEEIFITETETEKTEERDQQSTERYELKTEVDLTVQSDQEFKAGVNAKVWGPSYSVDANTSYARKDARSEAMKSAADIARETVAKSVTTLREKVRQQQTRRLTEEIEEFNEHIFKNLDPNAKNISGVYQWLEKVYEAQVFDYGEHTIYDLLVPEPAALLVEATREHSRQVVDKKKQDLPPEPEPLPDLKQIDDQNYGNYAKKYTAIEIEAPPEEFTTVSASFAGKASESWEWLWAGDKADLKIPIGYKATKVLIAAGYECSPADSHISVIVDGKQTVFDRNSVKEVELDLTNFSDAQDQISVAVGALRVGYFAVSINIHCKRTSRSLDDWKRRVYAALVKGYQKMVSERQQAITKLEAETEAEVVAEVAGRSPTENRKTMDVEIKRAVIARLAGVHYSPNCIEYDLAAGLPEELKKLPRPDLSETSVWEPTIRFLEQAFEWENMAYLFYPYYWSRKSEWVSKLLYSDIDPLFASFIKAGAAHVQLPVRLNFEAAVDHFCHFGKVWNGGPLPEIHDELYLAFFKEQQAQLASPGKEIPVSDPWLVYVPTELIKLRNDDRVPVFSNGCLFSVDPLFEKDLTQAVLSAGFRKEFEAHKIDLSTNDKIQITTEISAREWRISDSSNKRYFIVQKAESLNIYEDKPISLDPNFE